MGNNLIENSSLIKDVEAVQRFRDILYYQRQISNSTFILLLILRFPLIYLLVCINPTDPAFLIKVPLVIIAVAAVLFTPYIFKVLIKENKYGWITTFFVMIILPLLFAYILFDDALFFEAIVLIPLLAFYFYCYLIKFEVDKWLNEYSWHQERMQQKKEAEERIKNEMIL
jgi:hypothetical protein